jgi:rhodanese-related sulfurtransferase
VKLARDCATLLIVAALPALLSLWLHPHRPALTWAKPSVATVDLSTAMQWRDTALWVDARNPRDYATRHIPGAVSLNQEAWENLLPGFLAEWEPGKKIVVYCDSEKCDASAEVARRLQRELNISDLYVLKGGWAAWLQNQR